MLAEFRQNSYQLLSLLFFYPDEKRLKAASALAKVLRKDTQVSLVFPFFIEWEELVDEIQALRAQDSKLLQEQYVELFVTNSVTTPCLELESQYVRTAASEKGKAAVDIVQEYAAAGLTPSSELEEPPDHVAVELGFMSLLCEREKWIWEARQLCQGTEILEREAEFLAKHLNAWFPAFAQSVIARSAESMYASLVQRGGYFIVFDLERLNLIVERLKLVGAFENLY